MTIANVSLFVIIVLGITGFSLFDFRNLPFKENLKLSVTLGLILGINNHRAIKHLMIC